MARRFDRTVRVGDQMQRELTDLIRSELKDAPVRLEMVSITEVRVSRDFGHARVYVTTLVDEERDAVVEALQHAAPFLRKLLGRRMRLRTIPRLHFQYDDTMEKGNRLAHLIDEAIASDRDGDD